MAPCYLRRPTPCGALPWVRFQTLETDHFKRGRSEFRPDADHHVRCPPGLLAAFAAGSFLSLLSMVNPPSTLPMYLALTQAME